MLQPYSLEQKNGIKLHPKLFKRLLNLAIHNTMVILLVSPKQQKHRLTNIQAFNIISLKKKKQFWCFLSSTQPSSDQPPRRLTEHLREHISATGQKARSPGKYVVYKITGKGEHLFTDVVNVRQSYIQLDASRTTTQSSTSNPVASTAHIKCACVIR